MGEGDAAGGDISREKEKEKEREREKGKVLWIAAEKGKRSFSQKIRKIKRRKFLRKPLHGRRVHARGLGSEFFN